LASRASASAAPPFGQADLSNCELEQIHLAGSIQPHGALLVAHGPDLEIVQASANAAGFLGLPGAPVGRRLAELEGDLAERVRPHLHLPLDRLPMAVRCRIGAPPQAFDVLLHRPPSSSGGDLVIELERAGPPVELSREVGTALETVLACPTLRALCDETARIVWELTGYDRVMVYRFDEAGHGEVFSERRRPELEAFQGNRYPASDIPQIARRLYETNRVRVLVDVGYAPVAVRPRRSPATGAELDMSLCFLRSMSPIHIQYLKNMGVGATLVASLMVGGKLWGLISCHHYAPRFIHYEMRAVCELLAETVATRIAALESLAQAQAEITVRRLEQRMIQAISRDGDWRTALFDRPESLLQPLGATGAALLFEGQVLTVGEVPGTPQLREMGEWLDRRPRAPTVATATLGAEAPAFAPLVDVACGLLAAPVSSSSGEYLIWLRPERVRTVTWGGAPFKPAAAAAAIGNDTAQLSPRRSFAQWHEVVEGSADPWSPADLAAARLIGETVSDVVLQFRAVRTLIAQSQLEQVSRQVRRSGQPVLIADPEGRILLANQAFEQLVRGAAEPRLRWIEDLPALFADPAAIRGILDELFAHRRAWRGEQVVTAGGEARPMLLRADPVFSAPDHVLGFVLLFNDLTERRAADAARRRFQADIVERHRVPAVPLDSDNDLVFRDLLASVVGNAQLAALEITDGIELARVPAMLESVQSSVDRAAELLERLVWHAGGSGPTR
jgi:two-component system, chemotaxis family, sensor kinase Cph1